MKFGPLSFLLLILNQMIIQLESCDSSSSHNDLPLIVFQEVDDAFNLALDFVHLVLGNIGVLFLDQDLISGCHSLLHSSKIPCSLGILVGSEGSSAGVLARQGEVLVVGLHFILNYLIKYLIA